MTLAILFAYSLEQSKQLDRIEIEDNSTRAKLNNPVDKQPLTVIERADKIDTEQLKEKIRNAIEKPTIESLSILWFDYFSTNENYQEVLLPFVKQEGILKLISTFTEDDWSNWSNMRTRHTENQSEIGKFVSNIRIVNPELGLYFDSAAFLLSAVYAQTINGELFFIDESFNNYLEQKKLYIESDKIDSIINDKILISNLEKVRLHAINAYLRSNSGDLSSQLLVVLGVAPKQYDQQILVSFMNLLYRVIFSATSAFRLEILQDKIVLDTFHTYANFDSGIRRALARLYLIGSIDAVEVGEKETAKIFFEQSRALRSGIINDVLVKNFILDTSKKLEKKVSGSSGTRNVLFDKLTEVFGSFDESNEDEKTNVDKNFSKESILNNQSKEVAEINPAAIITRDIPVIIPSIEEAVTEVETSVSAGLGGVLLGLFILVIISIFGMFVWRILFLKNEVRNQIATKKSNNEADNFDDQEPAKKTSNY